MSQSKQVVLGDRLRNISPRVALVIPCLIPVLMGNHSHHGLSGVGLGGILLSKGVEDVARCLSYASPYYRVAQGIAEGAVGLTIMYAGLKHTSENNPTSNVTRRLISATEYIFDLGGITIGLLLIADGVLYFMPNTVQSNRVLSQVLTSQYILDSHKITNDEIWQQVFKLSLGVAQVFKILGGSAFALWNVQNLGQKARIPGLTHIYDRTIEFLKDLVQKIIQFVVPVVSGKHARTIIGVLLFLLGSGTSIDGWRRLIYNPANVSKDIFANLEILAGASGIFGGLYVAMTSLYESTDVQVHDLPQAITYSALSATLFKHEHSLWNHVPRLYEPPISAKVLFCNALAISLASNAANSLARLAMRPFGDAGRQKSKIVAKYGANVVWSGIWGLCSYTYLHKTLDMYVNLPFVFKNNVLSSVTCAAALFCGYMGFDFLLGNRPSAEHMADKAGRALVSGAAITGLLYFFTKGSH